MYFTPERNRDLAEKLYRHARETTTDMADDLVEYDLSIYSDPALAIEEREKIFQRIPMMALHSSQVPEPGSFATVKLNATNALVTRQKDGTVRAFVNACRHRGATVVSETSGKRGLFMCPYHGWSYANDGTLKAVGFAETFGGDPCGNRNLLPLPVEERHGFIWIVENPQAEIDVAAHLGEGMDRALAEYDFGRFHCYRHEVFEFPQNWKVMMDGLIDGYHVQFLHGKTISPYFYPNMMGIQQHGHHALWGNPRRRLGEILDQAPGDVPLDRYVIFGNLISPNSAMVLHPHHIEYWTVYQDPRNVSNCFLHLRYLTPQKEQDERGHEILAKNWKIATDAVINEDVPAGNSIQASAEMPFTGSIILGRNEVTNQIFHRAYRDYMAS
ncbi:aromatic ring-hydroxylating dioxygenase subunit alpha [Sphingomonas sp. CGMCC 1.13654]|uniref:Aromatic ring-hydroxylating dioxygenase subunit alpha n=1 Tax=Sphingomonas chungangi TaxID=2683589 RepID=A0A838L4M0_9SPHN|nr:aromatic ring-hydroxylating dioxygenase subunit alpha [Sphingomonas chungangi]MBA2933850.1 aromatic ring-hydroxylating dioxygenase subunit alpha [Sphingomonas chungangi]MVW55180.1 Rieske 2Fe-2S domain-containing protein [Sphingomonas chungangi]